MVFIYPFHVGFWCWPLWCGVKYLQGFCFGLYWVGLWRVQTCHLYHKEAFSNRKHSLRGCALAPLLSLYFYFGVEVRQWKLCTAWENHFEARTKTGREEKRGGWKYIGREWEHSVERCRRNERWLTGGTQLANHRGSCDAGVASLPFSQGRKLKVRRLIVPLKPISNMHAQAIWTHMHSHPTSGILPVYNGTDGPTLPSISPVGPLQPSAGLSVSPLVDLWPPARTCRSSCLFLSGQHLDRALPN